MMRPSGISTLLNFMLGYGLFLLREHFIDCVLLGLSIIHKSSAHFAILYKSSSISFIESAFSITVNKEVSSANRCMLHLPLSTISFIYKRNI